MKSTAKLCPSRGQNGEGGIRTQGMGSQAIPKLAIAVAYGEKRSLKKLTDCSPTSGTPPHSYNHPHLDFGYPRGVEQQDQMKRKFVALLQRRARLTAPLA